MKTRETALALVFGAIVWYPLFVQPQDGHPKANLSPGLESRLKEFFADKELQVQALVQRERRELPQEAREYFEAAANGDWATMIERYSDLRQLWQDDEAETNLALRGTILAAAFETRWGYQEATQWAEKYFRSFARDIIDSIPRGSIYFGGTDPGRFVITAFSRSHPAGDPFFTVTQNALADGSYLAYLREMYGGKIYTPNSEESQKAFQEYLADAQKRLEENKLKPGEDVSTEDGKVQVSGQVAVMSINGLLAKVIFEQNPSREFYIEESFPLDWMHPHLSPHGLVMKIHREPLTELSAETVGKDHAFWLQYLAPILGPWLKESTSVKELCDFAEQAFVRKDWKGFKGDPQFVQNPPACKTFSKLRSSQGGNYAWRAANAQSEPEKERMKKAADLAFRQAFALCPYSPEAIFRYTNLLVDGGRLDEAILIAETAIKIEPGNRQLRNLVSELQRMKTQRKR